MLKTICDKDIILRASNFTEEYIKPIARELDENNRFPKELLSPMRKEGFFSFQYPAKYGGGDINYTTAFNILRELSKGSAGVSLLYVVHWMATDVLLKYGTEIQKRKYLRDLVEGKKIAAYSISETSSGSAAAGIKTIAEKVENGWKINGEKFFVTNGGIADLYFVACKTSPDKGAKGISLFIVEKDTLGLDITYYADKVGFRSSATTNLILRDCIVPEENLIGELDKGYKVALDGLVGGRLGMAAIGVGISESALELAVRYSNNREVYNKPIATLYAIQEKIANIYIKLEGARELFYKACKIRDVGEDYSLEASVAKVAAADAVNDICYEAMQIMGGHGYIKYNDVERYFRDGRLIDIGVGTNEVLNMVIGLTVLNKK